MIERWLPMPGHDGLYEVSSEGRARSLYFDPPRILRPSRDSNNYPVIMLSKDGKRRPFTLHRMVCRAFNGEPNALHNEAAHLNGHRADARAANLKWASKVENHYHMRRHGTHPAGTRNARSKLTLEQVAEIRALPTANCAALARSYGVAETTVHRARTGRTWNRIAIAKGE